jgi:hypothetical protein
MNAADWAGATALVTALTTGIVTIIVTLRQNKMLAEAATHREAQGEKLEEIKVAVTGVPSIKPAPDQAFLDALAEKEKDHAK